MHRHSYRGRKLSRQTDQRQALIKGLATSLVLHEQIKTTLAKAKEVAPYFEKLVVAAKQADLAGRRHLGARLSGDNAVQKLIQELAPGWKTRQGGYTRVVKAGLRRGDAAPMAIVSLVMPEKPSAAPVEAKAEAKVPKPVTKPTAKPKTKPKAKVKA